MAGTPGDRPVSPHLSIWRWHVTMASSILHRVTGIALYGAAILFTIWLMLVAAEREVYVWAGDLLQSWFGQTALYLLVAASAYHFANGVRHLVFDTGAGLKPADADTSAWAAILFAVVAPIGLWLLVNFGG